MQSVSFLGNVGKKLMNSTFYHLLSSRPHGVADVNLIEMDRNQHKQLVEMHKGGGVNPRISRKLFSREA